MQEVGGYERSVRLLGATFRVVFNRIYLTHNTEKILMKQGNLNQFLQK